jgi:hypothetical protein
VTKIVATSSIVGFDRPLCRGVMPWAQLCALGFAGALHDGFQSALALLPVLQGGCQSFNSPTERMLLELLSKGDLQGSKINIAECLEILSEMAGALGDFQRAARLWGAADALREAINAPWPPLERRLYEPYLTAIRSLADEALWRRSWEEGRAMTMEEALTYALEDTQERT